MFGNSTAAQQPLILNLAPTGMVPTRTMSPHVPLQPKEIVADVLAAADVGITIAHLHARDENDEPTTSREVYARIIGGIRERRPDVIICVSCSGRRAQRPEDRADVLELEGDLKPDMASLTLSSLNFSRQASVNAPDTVAFLAERMRERDIFPEVEIFDLGMANVLHYLQERGLVPKHAYANILFGNIATAQANLLEIGTVASRVPTATTWSLAGLGAAQLPVAAVASAMAPAVRIGLEDNLWFDSHRTRFATNVELVERVHRFAQLLGRPIMTANAARELLRIGSHAVTAG
jgi:3-keto-5-aminohexanoate cleavage enzyme